MGLQVSAKSAKADLWKGLRCLRYSTWAYFVNRAPATENSNVRDRDDVCIHPLLLDYFSYTQPGQFTVCGPVVIRGHFYLSLATSMSLRDVIDLEFLGGRKERKGILLSSGLDSLIWHAARIEDWRLRLKF